MPKLLTDQQLRDIYDVVQSAGSCQKAAVSLGRAPSTVRQHYQQACERLGLEDGRALSGGQPISPHQDSEAAVAADRERSRANAEVTGLRAKYKSALDRIETLERDLGSVATLRDNLDPIRIEPRHGSGTSEATPVLVASDWHVEETVGAEVGGLNVYTPEIAETRARAFFTSGLRLFRLLNQDVKISTAVLPLLGDFITGNIHGEENAEKNALQPNHAVVFAQNLLIGGIQFLLEHTAYDFIIPCHSGNHARTTQKTRFASENGHSLEYLMYLHLAAYFREEKRLRFDVAQGMHSYLQVYDQTIRFHHGHAVKYNGGVGGIYIPTNKAVANWNLARHADVDVFGHFHQYIPTPRWVCNGSLIGYNAFALSIKAPFEKPKQSLFLVDKRRGMTCHWPVLV
jgi:hypothetical protein